MDRFEKRMQDRARKERDSVLTSIYGGLAEALERAGGVLTAINFKFDGAGCLIVIKAKFPKGDMVSFVWADDIPAGMVRAMKDAAGDSLRWREDRWNGQRD